MIHPLPLRERAGRGVIGLARPQEGARSSTAPLSLHPLPRGEREPKGEGACFQSHFRIAPVSALVAILA